MTSITTKDAALAWLSSARPGDCIVYHTGLLAADREAKTEQARTLNRVASAFFAAAQAGRVALTQRRLAPLVCAYLATLKSNSPAGKEEMPGRVSARTGRKVKTNGHIQRADLVPQ
jgi:hypothetical protein